MSVWRKFDKIDIIETYLISSGWQILGMYICDYDICVCMCVKYSICYQWNFAGKGGLWFLVSIRPCLTFSCQLLCQHSLLGNIQFQKQGRCEIIKKESVQVLRKPSTTHPTMMNAQGHHGESSGEGDQRYRHSVIQTYTKLHFYLTLGPTNSICHSPIKGSFSDVGGMDSPITIKNTVILLRKVSSVTALGIVYFFTEFDK